MHLLKIALLLGSILCGVLSVTDDEFQVNHQQILFSYFFLSFERGGRFKVRRVSVPLLQTSTDHGVGRPRKFHAKRGCPKPETLSQYCCDVFFPVDVDNLVSLFIFWLLH